MNGGVSFLPSPGKTCQCVGLAGGSAAFSSTSCSSCCSSSSPPPPSLSTRWTSSTSRGLWRVCGSELQTQFSSFNSDVLVSPSLIKLCRVRSRARSLPSSCRPSCCGPCRCSCPSSSTTQPSLNPTGPGTAQPAACSDDRNVGPLTRSSSPPLLTFPFLHCNSVIFSSACCPPTTTTSTRFLLSLSAHCYSGQVVIETSSVSIMICAVVTTCCSAAHGDEREEEQDSHASSMSNPAWHL